MKLEAKPFWLWVMGCELRVAQAELPNGIGMENPTNLNRCSAIAFLCHSNSNALVPLKINKWLCRHGKVIRSVQTPTDRALSIMGCECLIFQPSNLK